jgi:hypothetical protein
VHAASNVKRINGLKSKRIALGNPGSGTRVLAKTILLANGIDDENAAFQSIGGSKAAQALAAGEVDAAFFVSARVTDGMSALIRNPAIRVVNFPRAETYKRLYSYLLRIQAPEGVLAPEANVPPRNLDLVAPTTALVTRNDLHPALIDLVLGAANRVHQPGNLFTPADTFPSPNFVDFPLSSDARRYFKSGPTFLRRVLPFWAAVLVERLLIMLVPLITIMIPLFKIAPPAYRWGVRRKILRWYKELREIEAVVYVGENVPSREELETRLDEMQREAGHIKLPLGYAEQLYHLRLHIAFVKKLMMASAEESPAKAPA